MFQQVIQRVTPERRRKAALVAAGAIEWGDPVLSSSISTVVDERLYYRGKDAVVLSEAVTLEEGAVVEY